MKYLHLFITILFISSYTCKAQINQLTEIEIRQIEFSNISLQELIDSGADIVQVKNLLGSDIEPNANTTGSFLIREFWNNHIYLRFEDDSDTGNEYNLVKIFVENSSITVKVKDRVVKIGDSVTKFGNGVVINTKNGDYSVVFAGPFSSSLAFKINPLTNRISEIRFDVFY